MKNKKGFTLIPEQFILGNFKSSDINISQKAGFTLIELIIYVALLSIFISGAVLFTWDIIYGRVKSNIQIEVSNNLRFASKKILFEVRNASGVNYINPTDICLASSNSLRNPTRIYLNSGRIYIAWGGGSTNCTSMLVNEPLTSNQVTVLNFALNNLSSGTDSININFNLTVESNADRNEWQHSQSYHSSAEIRSN